jgi:hypothetical protein
VASAAVVEPLDEAVLPVDVPAQLAYTPQRGGGSSSVTSCNQPDITSSGSVIFTVSGGVFAEADDSFSVGENLIICYADFTPGMVEEQIIGPGGDTIRTTQFTVDELEVVQEQFIIGHPPEVTLAANDFTALPTDEPGVYTVIARTPDGEFTTTFEITDGLDFFKAERPWPQVIPIGQGTNAGSLADAEYILLTNFEPQEIVDIFFYESCMAVPDAFSYSGVRFTFVGGIKAQVNDEGYAFVAIEEDIANTLQPSPIGYVVTAIGTRSESFNSAGVLGSFESGAGDAIPGMAAFWAPRSMFDISQNIDQLPPCPAAP